MRSIPLALLLISRLIAQAPRPADDLADADKAIVQFHQLTRELSASLKRFSTQLDEAIVRQDHADVDLSGGSPDVMQAAVRKLAAFRMLAARSDRYHPTPLDEMQFLESLISQALQRDRSITSVLGRLLVVSVKDIDPRKDGEMKRRHDQLLKARAAMEEAAKQAYLALPIDLPDASSWEERNQGAWDLLVDDSSTHTGPPILPLRIQRRRRFTLIGESSHRVALTDSGLADDRGRHIFYQEEWVQRAGAVIRLRWRVAVDPVTGEHILLKRYPPLELHGDPNQLYRATDRDSLWYAEPFDDVRPAPQQVESAIADLAASRGLIRAAGLDFRTSVHQALASRDQRCAAAKEPVLDSGLSDSLREDLFAIRAHLAGVPAAIASERGFWQAVEAAEEKVSALEPLVAWANRISRESGGDSAEVAQWDRLLDRADREIDLLRNAENEAVVILPPNGSQADAKFPALQKDLIVRLRRLNPHSSPDGMVRFIEEIWSVGQSMPGLREVRRTATMVIVDPTTGNQVRARTRTKYYSTAPGDLLEEVFDEYAADDILIGDQT